MSPRCTASNNVTTLGGGLPAIRTQHRDAYEQQYPIGYIAAAQGHITFKPIRHRSSSTIWRYVAYMTVRETRPSNIPDGSVCRLLENRCLVDVSVRRGCSSLNVLLLLPFKAAP